MKKQNLELILVVPPKRNEKDAFDSVHYEKLYDYVAGFSLMTYDFSNPQRPGARFIFVCGSKKKTFFRCTGPNSPIDWVEENILHIAPKKGKRDKIWTGLNFYGMDYTPIGGGPLVGRDFVKKLENVKGKLKYDTSSEENFVEVLYVQKKKLVFKQFL